MRTGIGIDVHRLADGVPLHLAGLAWPDEPQGLEGHSDGDVCAHAMCDALLSAAGLGDLGSQLRHRGAGVGGRLGGRAADRDRRAGYDAPATRSATSPSRSSATVRGSARDATRRRPCSSEAVGAPVSLSATTTDGLGLTGRGEGIAAIATALVALMRAAVVVLAAGAGTRVGAEVNKVLLPLAGVPVVARSVRTALAVPGVRRVVLVVRDGEQDAVRAAVEPHLDRTGPEVAMVTGGEHPARLGVAGALRCWPPTIEAGEIDVVAMHDAARPLATAELYARVLRDGRGEHGGAIPVAPLDHLVDLDGAALPEPAGRACRRRRRSAPADLLAAHRAARAPTASRPPTRPAAWRPTPTWPSSRSSPTPATSSSPSPTTSWSRRGASRAA